MVRRKEYDDDEYMYEGTLLDANEWKELHDKRISVHAEKYNAHKKAANERQKEISEEGREIGPLPDCARPDLVEKCRHNLLEFMLTFGEYERPPAFPDPFSDAQLYAIQAVQETMIHGGSRPLCLPRSFGKTTICEWGMLWALAYGYQHFILIIAAKKEIASQILQNVEKIMTDNEMFIACFPALCYPIARLENARGRAPGQTLDGNYTKIKMNSQMLICPTVSGAPSSGAIVTISGLDSAVRGLKVGAERPTCVLVDDPQTERSAASVTQTEKRWNLLSGCIKGLVGHGKTLAMVATITVQNPEDLSEKILTEWGGQRFSMLRTMPENLDLWKEYDKLHKIGIQNYISMKDRVKESNAFYLSHRAEMDAGAEAEWETHYAKATEFSAIQHAMNLYFDNRKTFYAEYQNQPLAIFDESTNLTREQILRKILPVPRYSVPIDCERVTVGIDIQQDCLYWVTAAWGGGFRGHVLDYGRFPGNMQTIQSHYFGVSEKDAFYMALMELCPLLQSRTFPKEDGSQLAVTRGLIDANRGLFTPQVRRACWDMQRRSGGASAWEQTPSTLEALMARNEELNSSVPITNLVWEPVFGWGKGATADFCRGQIKAGEERGDGWQRLPLLPANLVRHTRYDTNYWKSNIRTFFQSPIGGSGSLTIFDGDEYVHYNFIQQMLSERSSILKGPRGTIDQWTMIPGRENHLWDCLTMAAVANAACGGLLATSTPNVAAAAVTYTADWDLIAK